MSFLDDVVYFASCFHALEHPAEVTNHAGVPFALVVTFGLSNILEQPFSMVIAHCPEIWREEAKVTVEKVNFE